MNFAYPLVSISSCALEVIMKAPLLLILTVWLNTQYGGCAVSSSCSVPPSEWCSSLDSAIQCGVGLLMQNKNVLYSYNTSISQEMLAVATSGHRRLNHCAQDKLQETIATATLVTLEIRLELPIANVN